MAPTMAGHAIEHAVARSKLAPEEVEDVILGCGFPEGAAGHNLGRQAAIRAGLPVTTSGMTINRFCCSGMQAISMAAQRIIVDGASAIVAGGVESISLVQNHANKHHYYEDWIEANKPEHLLPMIDTAELVAKRYGISRDAQDEFGLESQQPHGGRAAGRALRRRDRAAHDDQADERQGRQARPRRKMSR